MSEDVGEQVRKAATVPMACLRLAIMALRIEGPSAGDRVRAIVKRVGDETEANIRRQLFSEKWDAEKRERAEQALRALRAELDALVMEGTP